MISVDLIRDVITVDGKSIAISPMQAELSFCLARDFPKAVSTEELFSGVFGRDEPMNAGKILTTLCTELRHILAPLGIGIAAYKNKGRAFYLLRDGHPIGAEPLGRRGAPARNRIILNMRRQGLSSNEIADQLNESRNAVCGVLRRTKVTHNSGAPVA